MVKIVEVDQGRHDYSSRICRGKKFHHELATIFVVLSILINAQFIDIVPIFNFYEIWVLILL